MSNEETVFVETVNVGVIVVPLQLLFTFVGSKQEFKNENLEFRDQTIAKQTN